MFLLFDCCSFFSVPEGCEDPAEALQFFSSCFTARYGELHPLFYIGSLADALKEATGVPANHVRVGGVYINNGCGLGLY